MQFRLPHPWDPGFALPQNVMDEPPEFGVIITHQMPRGTYFRGKAPPPWQPGYALPGYVKREPVGAPAQVTLMQPRGTIYNNIPEYLGADTVTAHPPGGPNDPFVLFGRSAAVRVLGEARKLAPAQRKIYLKQVFDALDPGLWSTVAEKARQYQRLGQPAAKALESATAAAMANGLLRQVVNLGGARTSAQRGGMGYGPLGATPPPPGPGGAQGSITNPWDFVNITRDHRKSNNYFYMPAFQSAWKTALNSGKVSKKDLQAGKIPFAKFTNMSDANKEWGVYWDGSVLAAKPIEPEKKKSWWQKFKGFIRSVGRGITRAAKAVADAARHVVETVSNLACKALSTPEGKAAAIGGATAAGVPPQAGAAGANIASQMCGNGSGSTPNVPTAQSKFPILPLAIIGGVGIAAFVLLRK